MCIYPLAELTLSLAIFTTVIQCNAACQSSEPANQLRTQAEIPTLQHDMLPLKHLIIPKETTIRIVPFTKEPQGKIKSHCLASQRLCQHQVVGSMKQVRGVTPGTACAATVTIKKKNAAFEREASSIWRLVSRG